MKQEIGEFIKRIRESKKITQEELAKQAQLSRVQISNIERGVTSPRFATIQKIANALGVDIVQFWTQYAQYCSKQN